MTLAFRLTNRSGQTLVGEVAVPAAPQGLVFIQHGLSGSRRQDYIIALRERLYEQGLTVCTFDAANAWGESDGDLHQATLTNHYHDLCDVIAWASQQSWYRVPFTLVAHSLGGASAILYTLNHPEHVRALAPLSTVTGYRHWVYAYEKNMPTEWAAWQRDGYLEKSNPAIGRNGRISRAFLDDLRQYDLITHAAELHVPVFMLVGNADSKTPPECQKEFFDQLPATVQNISQLHYIDGAPHTFVDAADIEQLCEALSQWLQNLPENLP